ncbi:Aste57867_19086 [Aphanomyces stellatus]|uniref:D-xylose 1-dehydrogenase (NADP(+), D-xylono-1,5-lactone-forming) n=1 Tax=Aphanomyces stellatus TaxID=120398 RepID=A0A485LD73_9STRA|nr:hypothetical protein As57867_019022 [Aphanomyces stellatus]VFT95811.1 Aste57867_19086 [Aphanomyces stellatus]
MPSATSTTTTSLRWGILGCGKICNDFVMGLQLVDGAEIVACASRSLDTARAFGELHGIPACYDSYDALCADPSIDVVYVGTVHTYHFPHTMLALSRGKHVLVEKPMAMNHRDAAEMVALAQSKNLFLMEAMWTRFFPAVRHARDLLAAGTIGDVHGVHADMGFAFPKDAERIWKRELGGGGLLDIGIYPLAFVSMAFPGQVPHRVHTVGATSDQGVDLYAVVTLQYDGDRYGTIQYSCLADLREEVTILGTKGSLRITSPAHAPTSISLRQTGHATDEVVDFPLPKLPPLTTRRAFNFGNSIGLSYEAAAVQAAITRGDRESAEYPLTESLFLAKLMDTIRHDLGVVYDADDAPRPSCL